MDIDAQVPEIIWEVGHDGHESDISVCEITARSVGRYNHDYERQIAPQWIGSTIRTKPQLKTKKRHSGYVGAFSEGPKPARLFEK